MNDYSLYHLLLLNIAIFTLYISPLCFINYLRVKDCQTLLIMFRFLVL